MPPPHLRVLRPDEPSKAGKKGKKKPKRSTTSGLPSLPPGVVVSLDATDLDPATVPALVRAAGPTKPEDAIRCLVAFGWSVCFDALMVRGESAPVSDPALATFLAVRDRVAHPRRRGPVRDLEVLVGEGPPRVPGFLGRLLGRSQSGDEARIERAAWNLAAASVACVEADRAEILVADAMTHVVQVLGRDDVVMAVAKTLGVKP